MSYRISITNGTEKDFLALQRSIQERFREKWGSLEKNPRPQGCKKLRQSDKYRIRVGDYRMLYSINDDPAHVVILALGHRKEIYR